MQKIMFNDRFGLTEAVLDGRKTQTRRIALHSKEDIMVLEELNPKPEDESLKQYIIAAYSRFKKNEFLAVAQCLKDLGYDARDTSGGHIWGLDHTPAWENKMFVSAKECRHHIRIVGIRLERLQDISDEDCFAEGVRLDSRGLPHYGTNMFFDKLQDAYASLIDKVSGKGTWEKNPWVFVYDFELVK